MANHCIDVLCIDCGNSWCARGCHNVDEPNPEALERRAVHIGEWEQMHNQNYTDVMATGEVCGYCKSRNVVHD